MAEVTKIANVIPLSHEILYDPWTNPAHGVDIADDPLGDYNKLITIYRVDADRQHIPVRTVLYPYRDGDIIQSARTDTWHELNPMSWIWPALYATYYVAINGKRIIEVPGTDMLPTPVPRPTVPWTDRAWTKLSNTPRRLADNIAARLGYQPRCSCDDEY